MIFEEICARTFPGNRDEPNRAGITPRILRGTGDLTTKLRVLDSKQKGGHVVMLSSYRIASLSGAILGTLVVAALAQQVEIAPRKGPSEKPQEPTTRSNIRVDSNLVLIPVTVTDPMN